jgi:hypothetical protein
MPQAKPRLMWARPALNWASRRVAVGAAIGAMLPSTRLEEEYLGSASAKVRKEAETVLAEGVGKAKNVASDVYEAAREEADRQGLTPGDKPVAQKVAEVARAAGSELKTAGDETINKLDEQPGSASASSSTFPRTR